MIILLNAFYGFMMVVVHVFIFREPSDVMGALEMVNVPAPAAAPAATAAPTYAPAAAAKKGLRLLLADGADERLLYGAVASRHKRNWYLQIIDLDLAWAHGVLGFNDWYLCIFGLTYGVIIIAFSIFVLQAVLTASRTAAVISRWFMMFLHLELILYVLLILVKLPMLCRIKHHFLTLMNEDCNVLKFMFFERAVSRIIIGSLCCWVFSSFAYLLAWGDGAIDDATDGLDQVFSAFQGSRRVLPEVGFSPPTRAYPQASSGVLRPQGTRASFDRVSMVGDAVNVGSKYEPRFVGSSGATRGSFPAQTGAYPSGGSFNAQRGSFNATGVDRYGGSSHIMPRASSSHQSNASGASAYTAERQMLIKPPVVIH
jgi:hypothetical protein